MEEGKRKLAAVHASLERDDGPPTVSVVLQSNEQFDGSTSTSLSSNSASTGRILTVSRDYENLSLTRTIAIAKRQQIMNAGDQISHELVTSTATCPTNPARKTCFPGLNV
jgi:hypothetical protein